MPTKYISQLPAGPDTLEGTELLEIQNGVTTGASQQTTSSSVAQIALRQSVQSIQAGTGGVVIDSTNLNSPKISVPVPTAGAGMSIDETNPEVPVYNCLAAYGGISAAYGSPGGSALSVGENIQGIAAAKYTLTGWAIQCSPAGSIQLDFRTGALGGTPTSIIGTGTSPSVSGATSASGNVTGWTSTSVLQGQLLEVAILSSTEVQWFNVVFFGTRV